MGSRAAAPTRLAASELSRNPQPPMDIRETMWEIKKRGSEGAPQARAVRPSVPLDLAKSRAKNTEGQCRGNEFQLDTTS